MENEDRKRQLGDPNPQRAVKRNKIKLDKQSEEGSHVQSQDITEAVQEDSNMVQEAIEPSEGM